MTSAVLTGSAVESKRTAAERLIFLHGAPANTRVAQTQRNFGDAPRTVSGRPVIVQVLLVSMLKTRQELLKCSHRARLSDFNRHRTLHSRSGH